MPNILIYLDIKMNLESFRHARIVYMYMYSAKLRDQRIRQIIFTNNHNLDKSTEESMLKHSTISSHIFVSSCYLVLDNKPKLTLNTVYSRGIMDKMHTTAITIEVIYLPGKNNKGQFSSSTKGMTECFYSGRKESILPGKL
jgi:hypothetical protein